MAQVKLQVGAEVKIGQHTFRVTDFLGSGNQGSVWSATRTDGSYTSAAIKECICEKESEWVAAEREPVIMQSIVAVANRDQNIIISPHIIACETKNNAGVRTVRVAMTRIPGESLSTFLSQFEEATANANAAFTTQYFCDAHRFTFALLSQLVSAFQSISLVAFHRDVSAENVLVSTSRGISDPEFGLIDFGLSTQSEVWPTIMHKVCAVGNCYYWPPSAWFIFMYGGSKLHEDEALRQEYMTQLDMHGVGVLGLQVLMTMIPQSAYAQLPELMLALKNAWNQYWKDQDSFCEGMHQACQGLLNWEKLRSSFIQRGVHRVIALNIFRVRDALSAVAKYCSHVDPRSPLSGSAPLFTALMRLLSNSYGGLEDNATWSDVQAILGGRSLSADAVSVPEPNRVRNFMPPVATTYTNMPPTAVLPSFSPPAVATIPMTQKSYPLVGTTYSSETETVSNSKPPVGTSYSSATLPIPINNPVNDVSNNNQSPPILVRSRSLMAPLPEEDSPTPQKEKDLDASNPKMKEVPAIDAGSKPSIEQEELETPRTAGGSKPSIDQEKPQTLVITGATGANAAVVNGIYDLSGFHKKMPSWQKRGSKYVIIMMNRKWWVSDTDSKATGRVTGWAKSSRVEDLKPPTYSTTWEVWTGNAWESQSILVSECNQEDVRQVPVQGVPKFEKFMMIPEQQMIENTFSPAQVQNKEVSVPQIHRVEKVKMSSISQYGSISKYGGSITGYGA
mmetsp:Transcript_71364/g.113099  ORF Transcript_71364/g.113099 Transcript_71364/m.113099 type:complete len:733 (-) Transcript_71364:135-2333(-)